MIWGQTKPPLGSKINWSHPLAKGLVGCWLFNEGMGDKVYDLINYRNHIVINNMSYPAITTSGWNPNKYGTGLNFNGTSNYGSCNPFDNNLDINFTIRISVRIRDLNATNKYILQLKYGAAETHAVIFGFVSKTFEFFNYSAYNGTDPRTGSQMAITTNGDYEVVYTYDGITFSGYLNGVRKVNIQKSFTMKYIPNYLKFCDSNIQFFNGNVNYMTIHNRCLNENQTIELYRSPFCFIN